MTNLARKVADLLKNSNLTFSEQVVVVGSVEMMADLIDRNAFKDQIITLPGLEKEFLKRYGETAKKALLE